MVTRWVIGAVVYRAVIGRVVSRDLFTALCATFGIAIVIRQGLNLAFGPDSRAAVALAPTSP